MCICHREISIHVAVSWSLWTLPLGSVLPPGPRTLRSTDQVPPPSGNFSALLKAMEEKGIPPFSEMSKVKGEREAAQSDCCAENWELNWSEQLDWLLRNNRKKRGGGEESPLGTGKGRRREVTTPGCVLIQCRSYLLNLWDTWKSLRIEPPPFKLQGKSVYHHHSLPGLAAVGDSRLKSKRFEANLNEKEQLDWAISFCKPVNVTEWMNELSRR